MLNAASKYHYRFLSFLSASAGLELPTLPHQWEKLRSMHQHISAVPVPLVTCLGFSIHILTRYPADPAPRSTYIPALHFSFLVSDFQCLTILCPPQYRYIFYLWKGLCCLHCQLAASSVRDSRCDNRRHTGDRQGMSYLLLLHVEHAVCHSSC